MKISIFGLGYIGSVSAACLAEDGHQVIGVDTSELKVSLINSGKSPVVEKDVNELIHKNVGLKKISATQSTKDAILNSELSFICVGTPSKSNGSLDLSYVANVCEEIGRALIVKDQFHVVVMRSTMLPSSMETIVIPNLERFSGKKMGIDFGVCINPEFLREGTAVYDYLNPPKTVIGESDTRAGDMLVEIYKKLPCSLIRTDLKTAEMVKYTDNVWHAVKVVFANEIGNLSKELSIDSHKVMEIFCEDTKLNLSPYYLKPGFAFGGSCLPKDVRAINYKARTLDIELPLISSLLLSNRKQIDKAIEIIASYKLKRIGILGFAFKAGTDDLRESPLIELIETLSGKGYELKIYDKNVNIARLTGANLDFINQHIPHIAALMKTNIFDVTKDSDLIVIGNNSKEFEDHLPTLDKNQVVIDLVRLSIDETKKYQYEGICW